MSSSSFLQVPQPSPGTPPLPLPRHLNDSSNSLKIRLPPIQPHALSKLLPDYDDDLEEYEEVDTSLAEVWLAQNNASLTKPKEARPIKGSRRVASWTLNKLHSNGTMDIPSFHTVGGPSPALGLNIANNTNKSVPVPCRTEKAAHIHTAVRPVPIIPAFMPVDLDEDVEMADA